MAKYGNRIVPLIAGVVLTLCASTTAQAGRIAGSISTGLDSYSERYSIVDADTVDQFTEFRTRIILGYTGGTITGQYFRLEGLGLIGQQSIESGARLFYQQRSGKHRFTISAEGRQRQYQSGTRYSFPNDFLRFNTRVTTSYNITPQFAVSLSNRSEYIGFDRRTEFDYDYLRNVVNIGFNLDRGFATTYQAAIGYGFRFVPDSTQISYDAYLARVEYRRFMGVNRQIYLTMNGERRIYNDRQIKSGYWSMLSSARLQPITIGSFGMGIDNDFEGYFYDFDSDAFGDYVENWTALMFSYYPTVDLAFRVGPTFGLFAGGFGDEDNYHETGAKVTLDYTASRVWFSGSYEPGFRNYRLEGASPDELFFSDYLYNRVIVFGSLRLLGAVTLNTFLNFEPENHRVENDDATATLFSLDLQYTF